MLFAKGTRVRFLHTGYEGEIVERIGDEMVTVRLEDGDEIPAFLSDLKRIDKMGSKSPVKAKVVKIIKPPANPGPDKPEVAPQYAILKSMGIQLAFDPETRAGSPAYQIYLINDTPFDVIFTFSLSVNGRKIEKLNGKLKAVSVETAGRMSFDSLNDSPRVEIECWKVSTQGTGKRLHKEFRIKPQQFFKRLRTAPILNRRVHHYKVFEKLEEQASSGEDLKTYTQRRAQPLTRLAQDLRAYDILHPNQLASFKPEIDLHIEKLSDQHHRMNKADILRLQIKHFEAFLEQAIQLGVSQVFVIHGLGKGKLKDAIASRLISHPRVQTFKNEFHPRYGFGATEILLE